MYVPDLRDNLLSVRKFTNAGIEVKFVREKATIFYNNEVIATAQLHGNLYELLIDIPVSTVMACNIDDTMIWHRRLGHIGAAG